MNSDEKEVARQLLTKGAIKFGEFKLKLHEKNPNAPLSPIYIDLRILRSFPFLLGMVAHVYRGLATKLKFDYIADVPTAATPIAVLLSSQMQIPMVSPRMDAKTHGLERKVDGVYSPGHDALLVDDLITTAASKLEAISVLEEAGIQVHDVVVLVDREQGGVQELESRRYWCHSVFKLSGLLEFYVQEGLIHDMLRRRVTDYLRIAG